MATDQWGVDDGYWDIAGGWHDAAPQTKQALRVAMGGHADVEDPPPRSRPVWLVRAGTGPAIERPARLVLEDGTDVDAAGVLPPDLPLGYHDLHPSDGGPTTRLIVTPPRCHLPEELRAWGWTAQLYAARSAASWGIGDLGDLRRLAEWSASLGAGVLALNPLHAALPLDHQEPSPYFPSSRRFRNPLYIRIEDAPGYGESIPELVAAATAGRALNDQRHIDRDQVWALKRAALTLLWNRFTGDPRFEQYLTEKGTALRQYATFCALVEEHGCPWPAWPAEHRRPDGPGVARFEADRRDRVRFHAWLQWLLHDQLERANAALPLLYDLAVGVDANGADGWVWQDVFAPGVRVGAPPDEFNTQGQDWGFPPFVPWRLRAAGYEPFVQTLRATLEHAGAVRIDHVMGLFRLFWIPPGGSPRDGAYVRYPGTDLLDIVALESVRAGAVIVGEDLGTVEDDVRTSLHERGVLSYRLLWFEPEPPETFPRQALAAVTTHDLPTVAGLWSGRDLAAQKAIGLDPNEASAAALRDHIGALAGVAPDAPAEAVVAGAYERLSRAPSMIVTATLDDALCVEERPNLPGTVTEWPNWCLALPAPLEAVEKDERVERVATALRRGREHGAEALKRGAN
jgi:4-alpha-glucanotransferase